MPESREATASHMILDDSLSTVIKTDGFLPLEGIEIDATDKEAKRFPKGHLAQSGLPYQIDSSCAVKRGQINLRVSSILKYGEPPESKSKDRRVVSPTSYCMVRKFRVGMALVFTDYVIGFLSSDLVFQPTWALSRDELSSSPSDFYSREWDFLPALSEWMLGRVGMERNGLACEVIRTTNDVFLGIGVYTVIEIFFLAGLSPFLTEAELFNNPSRVARLCRGYFEFLHKSHTSLWMGGYLAPTTQHRLGYIDWLHVYAKDRCKIPYRMAKLVDDYVAQVKQQSTLSERWTRYDTDLFYDVSEPTLLSTFLSLDHNLGHLVFGTHQWTELGGTLSECPDPVTSYFAQQGLLGGPTFLRPAHYSPLFLDHHNFCAQSLLHQTVYTYRNNKQIWSITPLPQNSQGVRAKEDSAKPQRIEGMERKRMLSSYIVQNTQKVAIGPLEYCGNTHCITMGRSTIVVPCYGDPSLPEFYAERDLKNHLMPNGVHGERRPSLTAGATKELESQMGEFANSHTRKQAPEEDPENVQPDEQPKRVKTTRLSADKRLALLLASETS
ncbi:hypothetical protein K438DRAFT_1865641 [Mycena galopus ATCC 62051]|nr:hypothetical protein K438DRAFT_1865641 [Mycena galopus ATCC 62051]